MRIILHQCVIVMLLLTGCSPGEPTVAGRWYTQSQVDQGREVFAHNCVACHGQEAQGSFAWRRPLADGTYPPPPLNGRAHTWHHPMAALQRTIRDGSTALGGSMPGFKETLSEDEIKAVIAFFQSKWQDRIYRQWEKRGGAH